MTTAQIRPFRWRITASTKQVAQVVEDPVTKITKSSYGQLPLSIIYLSLLFLASLASLGLSIDEGCIHRPTNSNNCDISRLPQTILYLSGLPSCRNLIAYDFNFPERCWPSSSIPATLLNFALETHAKVWIQHVTTPTKFHNILDLGFTHNPAISGVSALKPSPGVDRKMAPCSLPHREEPSSPMPANHTVSSLRRRVGTKHLTTCEPLIGPGFLYRLARRMQQTINTRNFYCHQPSLYPHHSA